MERSSSAIVNGTPSPEEEDYVVDVLSRAGACTGTLLAPNVVLTALHCVSDFNPDLPFTCGDNGVLYPDAKGAGQIGDLIEASRIEIRVGPASSMGPPVAHGERLFSSGSNNICVNDIAVIVLDRDLEPSPRQVRLGRPIARRELVTLIGFGQDENKMVRIRNRRTDVRVTDVGSFASYEQVGSAPPRTFKTGEGACHGDSGGPAFSQETSALIGVYSMISTNIDCAVPGVRNIFTQVAPFQNLLNQAMEYAGHELLLEPEPDPMGGGSGMGGASAGGADGSAGEGDEGSAAGGSAATSAGSSSGSSSGSSPVPIPIGEGSGSREDVSCACRTGGRAPLGASGWFAGGLFVVAVSALLRRRSR